MNYGTLIDNQLHPAPRAFMLHGAMVTNPKAGHFAALNAERATHGLPPYLPIVEIAPGYSAEAALTDCDYVEEGFPNAERWNALLDGAATALGKTREEIDAFLDAIQQNA